MNKQIITHTNFAKGFRGGERQTLLLIKELSKKGYLQKVFTRVNSNLADRLEGIKNLTIIRAKKPYIFSLSKAKNSSIIHAHEAKGAQFAYFANLFYKIPYIITRRVSFPIKNNFFNRAMYTNSSYVVTVANYIQDTVKKINKDLKFKTINSAYSDLKIDNKEVQNIKDRYKSKFIIGTIGELEHLKGQYYLIEAIRMLNKEFDDIELILLGKGSQEELFKEQTKNLDNVTFTGFVNNVGDYIQCFDIFVFPSLSEGIASILFDIMKSDVAIVTTNVGGIPEYMINNKNGILVESKNIEVLYKAIKELYLDKELRDRLSKEALKNIENYSISAMTQKYEEIYKEIKS